jgi:hypothetical protein
VGQPAKGVRDGSEADRIVEAKKASKAAFGL